MVAPTHENNPLSTLWGERGRARGCIFTAKSISTCHCEEQSDEAIYLSLRLPSTLRSYTPVSVGNDGLKRYYWKKSNNMHLGILKEVTCAWFELQGENHPWRVKITLTKHPQDPCAVQKITFFPIEPNHLCRLLTIIWDNTLVQNRVFMWTAFFTEKASIEKVPLSKGGLRGIF